ncbi:putative alternative oxidase protein [Phaeoacremonium minimum UCRPA7]|uniref:Putative alternative oxidase protein n=1 Tax=Phaeoacremonium minimum (strain UCR-PA7) TaxID=1286976 RepID=R8BI19_PHAM7|nr:putative alternative oxidase protein [Phaeoacremonium minimum UCRPA7]EON98887.1 putative alternative oxidase protein [Phaeoacremonium minimum UCRPA7]
MLCQGHSPVVVFMAASLLIIFWSFRLFDVPHAVLRLFYEGASPQQLEESEFIRRAMNVEFPTPIDYRPIREACARTQFQPGLLFSCQGQHGGIGMVRNQILKCVRYAIHGGGAIVVPSMALRNASDITDIETSTEVPLDYLLDRDTFTKHLSEGCPGMRIYERAEDFPFYEQREWEPLSLVGDQFEPDHPPEGLKYPREWRHFFDDWLGQQSVQIRPETPVHIKIEQSFLEYPVRDDGDAFVREFGKILSFRNDTRALAAKVLFELNKKFELSINPTKAINPGAFYGAHLRLEDDATWAWSPDEWRFSRMKDQFEEQFRNVARANLNVVYAASGNQTVVELFAEGLRKYLAANLGEEERNVTVVTKHDLLQGSDRQKLDSLTFDQHALVDFLVLFKASAFMGVAHSSFPWNIALRRHELSRYAKYGNEGSDLLRDEYSVIMGMEADYPHVDPFVYGLWP